MFWVLRGRIRYFMKLFLYINYRVSLSCIYACTVLARVSRQGWLSWEVCKSGRGWLTRRRVALLHVKSLFSKRASGIFKNSWQEKYFQKLINFSSQYPDKNYIYQELKSLIKIRYKIYHLPPIHFFEKSVLV